MIYNACFAEGEKSDEFVHKFHKSQQMADIYYAYHIVHRYLAEPFTSYEPISLLNVSRYIATLVPFEPYYEAPEHLSLV